jgi:hypothetical protein
MGLGEVLENGQGAALDCGIHLAGNSDIFGHLMSMTQYGWGLERSFKLQFCLLVSVTKRIIYL